MILCNNWRYFNSETKLQKIYLNWPEIAYKVWLYDPWESNEGKCSNVLRKNSKEISQHWTARCHKDAPQKGLYFPHFCLDLDIPRTPMTLKVSESILRVSIQVRWSKLWRQIALVESSPMCHELWFMICGNLNSLQKRVYLCCFWPNLDTLKALMTWKIPVSSLKVSNQGRWSWHSEYIAWGES